jgi:hypothetical protein
MQIPGNIGIKEPFCELLFTHFFRIRRKTSGNIRRSFRMLHPATIKQEVTPHGSGRS